MPVRRLPSNPNLDHLKYQARDLLEDHAACAQGAAQRIREFHPRFGGATDSEIFGARLSLSDAQLAIAREYGFPSWTRLQRHIERPSPISWTCLTISESKTTCFAAPWICLMRAKCRAFVSI